MSKSLFLFMTLTLLVLSPVVLVGYIAYQLCAAWAMGWHIAEHLHRNVNRQIREWEQTS